MQQKSQGTDEPTWKHSELKYLQIEKPERAWKETLEHWRRTWPSHKNSRRKQKDQLQLG